MVSGDDQGNTKGSNKWLRHAAIGVVAGCFAGIPQVLVAQAVGALSGRRSEADIGPRFVQRTARLFRRAPSRPERWSLAAVFHFAYAAGWGAAYGMAAAAVGVGRVPPLLAGGSLGTLIYAVAFSRLGAATLTGTERHPDRRGGQEWLVQLVSAFSYAFTLAYLVRWLAGRK